jgi:Acetyltransferases, including N-acetylases of ribosomal proteins
MSMREVLETITGRRPQLALSSTNLLLRIPEATDFAEYVRVRRANAERLRPVEPTWARDALSRSGFRRRLRHAQDLHQRQQGLALFMFLKDTNKLIGGITLSWLDEGRPGTAMVGYWLDGAHEGQGLMKEGLLEVCRHAHGSCKIRRIEAACLPENARSVKLLEACGFEREGLARQYLNINGAHRDHLLFARLHADPPISE